MIFTRKSKYLILSFLIAGKTHFKPVKLRIFRMAPGMMIVNKNPIVSNWSLERGYKNNFEYELHKHDYDLQKDSDTKEYVKNKIQYNLTEYPARIGHSGQRGKLEVELVAFPIDYKYKCNRFGQGFKVALTQPGEAVKMSKNFFRLSFSEETRIKITPKLITTSEGLRSYTPQQRQCFYQSERKLRFYKLYTQINCEAECLANFTKLQCGCVKFSMPRDKNTKICGSGSITCYQLAEKTLATGAESFRDECNCLPACTSIDYNIEIESVYFLPELFSVNNLDGRGM